MRRLVYAPEVYAYVKSSTGRVYNLSNDIISGSVTRRLDAPSSASLMLQNRNKYWNGRLLPMDRIIIYLKKTKPILVFSGYLDTVPYIQPYPGPITITATCTLKRLSFTYWDPTLPNVQLQMAKFIGEGAIPNLAGGPFIITPQNKGTEKLSDVGFGKMLHFLVNVVGKWPKDKVHVMRIPPGWIDAAIKLFNAYQQSNEEQDRLTKQVLSKFLTTEGNTDLNQQNGTAGDINTPVADVTGDELDSYLKSKNSPLQYNGELIVQLGNKYRIDPRLCVAVAGSETAFGLTGNAESLHNAWGMGPGNEYPSWGAGAEAWFKNLATNSAYKDKHTIAEIQTSYAPSNAANDPNGLNSNWTRNVSKFFSELGGNPDARVKDLPALEQRSAIDAAFGRSAPATSDERNKTLDVALGSSRATNEPATTSNSNGKFNLMLEVGHAEPRQPGYVAQTGAIGEIDQNRAIVNKVKSLLAGEQDIEITDAHGSQPGGWQGDLYISVHHDASIQGVAGVNPKSHPGGAGCPAGVTNCGATTGPHIYTGATLRPLSRDNIHSDSNLIAFSQKFKAILLTSLNNSGTGNYTDCDNSQARMSNYYGFYYNVAPSNVIVEFPLNKTGGANLNKVAKAIAEAIKTYKNSSGAKSGGDNTPIAKMIRAMVKVANNNQASNPRIPYELGGPYNKKLSDFKAGDTVDCSGFVKAGMLEVDFSDSSLTNTPTYYTSSSSVEVPGPQNIKPGTMILRGGVEGGGPNGHIQVYIGDGKVVESTGGQHGKLDGPQVNTFQHRDENSYFVINGLGTTDNPGVGTVGTDTGVPELDAQTLTNQAFNTVFNFPGDPIESMILRGQNALENDVKLIESVTEVAQGSLRTFASHPNGDFMAWFPDYFNVSGKTPYLHISENEMIDCTINLSDVDLATHVYVRGNINQASLDGTGFNTYLEQLLSRGVVTIEQAYLLDSFLSKSEDRDATFSKLLTETGLPDKDNKRSRRLLDDTKAVRDFLNRYGARPMKIPNPSVRHPLMEFFMAYQWFQRKWAELFQSTVNFTFMPELFPGTIVKMGATNVNFFVEEVTHNFDYSGGFTTDASLTAPSTDKGHNFGMALTGPPFKKDEPITVEQKNIGTQLDQIAAGLKRASVFGD